MSNKKRLFTGHVTTEGHTARCAWDESERVNGQHSNFHYRCHCPCHAEALEEQAREKLVEQWSTDGTPSLGDVERLRVLWNGGALRGVTAITVDGVAWTRKENR